MKNARSRPEHPDMRSRALFALPIIDAGSNTASRKRAIRAHAIAPKTAKRLGDRDFEATCFFGRLPYGLRTLQGALSASLH